MRKVWLALLVVATAGVVACADRERGAGEEPKATPTAGSAELAIVPRRGIAGVRLGMTSAVVQNALGAPDQTASSRLHGGWTEWRYEKQRLTVTFDGDRSVWSVRSASREHRTPTGAGVGSTEAGLVDAMPSLHCRPYGGPARYRRWRTCDDAGDFQQPFTEFTLVGGVVRRVTVARGLAI